MASTTCTALICSRKHPPSFYYFVNGGSEFSFTHIVDGEDKSGFILISVPPCCWGMVQDAHKVEGFAGHHLRRIVATVISGNYLHGAEESAEYLVMLLFIESINRLQIHKTNKEHLLPYVKEMSVDCLESVDGELQEQFSSVAGRKSLPFKDRANICVTFLEQRWGGVPLFGRCSLSDTLH